MNRVYRLVWNRSLGMFVPRTELARSRKKTKRAAPALLLLLGSFFAATAANATTFLDFNGGLSSWTTGGNVTLSSTTVTVPTGGATFTLTPAAGYDMARINAPNGGNLLAPDATLGLSANSLSGFLGNSITNFGLLTKSFSFNPGTYTFAWAYGAEDYQPYNDGAVFTLSGNGSQSLVSLARNGTGPSDTSGPSPDTLILGSYGATPWLTMSFDIATTGTYQLGFAVYNWADKSLAPNLYVSGVAGTYSGTPVQVSGGSLPPPPPPVIGGTGGNVAGSVFDPTSPAYSATTLTFAGGTLQYTSDMSTSKDATLTAAGGAIDTNGYNVAYSGVISGGSDFFKQGTGTLTLSSVNTYSGITNIDAGTLKLIGTGAIDSSSGVVNNGTLDISGTTAGAAVTTMSGSGAVDLGSQKLTVSNASSTFAGTINGAGSVEMAAGSLTLTGTNTYTGETQIDSGVLTLTSGGSIAESSDVVNNGTLDIAGTTAGASIKTMSGTGSVNLGNQTLTLTNASGTFAGTLAGSGSLEVAAGNLVLAGSNNYTGTTQIDAGTLKLTGSGTVASSSGVVNNGTLDIAGTTAGASIKTISGTGSVDLGSKTLTVTNAANTYAGKINGTGSVELAAGNLQLTGANTYSGATTIDSGVLTLSGSGSIATSSGVVNNGTLDIAGTTAGASVKTIAGSGIVALGSKDLTITQASGSYDGGFTGAGAVNISGGTLTLGGSSSHTGGMNVTSGAKLVILNDAALGQGGLTLNDGALANDTSLAITQAIVLGGTSAIEAAANTSITAAGSLSGAGNLLKSGSGSLVLAGDNTSLGQGASTASIVVNDGTLVVANSKALGNANVQLNAGSLTAQQTMSLTGTLQVAANTSISTAPSTVLTLNSQIASVGSGDGCFEKNGAGTLVMSGRADITPGTCVQDGKLYANGLLTSNVTVKSDGVLRGTGIIQGNTNVAGRLAPGNSPGTLQIAGTVTMGAASIYQEDINGLGVGHGPGNYSRLIVSGSNSQFVATGATLEPNLTHVTGTDTYVPYVPKVGDAFRIVTAEGGIVGRFASVTQPDGLLANTRIETYYNVGHSNSIDLVVVPTSYQAYVRGLAANRNAQSAAGALDSLATLKQAGATTAAQDSLLYMLSTQSALPNASTALAGEVHGALAAAEPLANSWLADAVGRQLYGSQSGDGTGLWVDTGANRSDWNADSVASGFDTTRSQIAVGWEPLSSDSVRAGFGFTHGKVDVQDSVGSGSMTQDLGFVYGQARAGRLVFDALASIGSSDWETSRTDPLSPGATLSTDTKGHDSAITVGMRIPFATRAVALSPYVRFTSERMSRDSFDEGNASVGALSSGDHVGHGTRTTAGLVGGSREQRPTAAPFGYQFDIGVGRDSNGLAQPTFAASLAGMSTVVSTPDIGRTFGFARLGGTARLTSWMYSYFGVSAESRSGKSEDLGANLGVRATF